MYRGLVLIVALISITLIPAVVSASEGQAGAYLKLGVGARALGLGGAFTAIADDVTAIFWNPGGIANLDRPEISAMHANMTIDRQYDFVGFSTPIDKKSAWGVAYTRFSINGIPETRVRPDGSGDPILTDDNFLPDGTWDSAGPGLGDVEVFSMFDDVEDNFTLSYSRKISPVLSVGANLRFLQQQLFDQTANGVGFDFGALYKYSDKLSFGVSVRDLFEYLDYGVGMRNERVPVTATAGVAYELIKDGKVSLDICQVENLDLAVNVGAEKWFSEKYAIRLGANDGELTAGASIKLTDWQFDFAYETQELGDIQRLSFNKKF
jgi:long-subunit fatty acid transport protein